MCLSESSSLLQDPMIVLLMTSLSAAPGCVAAIVTASDAATLDLVMCVGVQLMSSGFIQTSFIG